jgi:hypothetical protein
MCAGNTGAGDRTQAESRAQNSGLLRAAFVSGGDVIAAKGFG